MLKKIYILILISIIGFVQGCSRPLTSIYIEKQKPLRVTVDVCTTELPWNELDRKAYGGPIDVERHWYQDTAGHIIIFESAKLDDPGEFIVGDASVMVAGFEFFAYRTRWHGRYHTYIEGEDRNQKPIYLIFSGIGVQQEFSLLYSQDKEALEPILNCLGVDVATHKAHAQTFETSKSLESYIQSDWSAGVLFRHDIVRSKYAELL